MSDELKSFWKERRTLARFAAIGYMLIFPFLWLYCILVAFKDGKRAVIAELKDGPETFMCGFWVAFRKS